jgi:hypothetical protein
MSVWPVRVACSAPVAGSHSRTVPSSPAEASRPSCRSRLARACSGRARLQSARPTPPRASPRAGRPTPNAPDIRSAVPGPRAAARPGPVPGPSLDRAAPQWESARRGGGGAAATGATCSSLRHARTIRPFTSRRLAAASGPSRPGSCAHCTVASRHGGPIHRSDRRLTPARPILQPDHRHTDPRPADPMSGSPRASSSPVTTTILTANPSQRAQEDAKRPHAASPGRATSCEVTG